MANSSKSKVGKSARGQASGTSQSSGPAARVQEMIDLLEGTDISHLEWSTGSERIVLSRGAASHAPTPFVHPAAPVTAPAAGLPSPKAGAEAPTRSAGGQTISSPFVGTFYRASSPDGPAFVEVGQTVKKGQVLCIVEAMKLMNEIEAEVAGKVLEILVENGKTVEFGQPLFTLQAS